MAVQTIMASENYQINRPRLRSGDSDQEPKKPRLITDPSESGRGEMSSVCRPANPFLGDLKSDFLYHIGYNNSDCVELFKDVKVRVA